MEHIVELNRGPFVGAQPEPPLITEAPDSTQILDTRPVTAFAAGHLAGALSVPVSGTRFATKAAFVLDSASTAVAATDEAEAAAAIRGLRSVGLLDIVGYVLGGGPERLEVVSIDELDALLADGAELIDVREKDERDTGYIAGSRNIPYRLLALGEADLPRDRPIVTICETGPRAAIAASILAAHGFDAHPVVDGGIDSWVAAGRPTVEFRRCGS
jgi:hydroxyacylglutathione hydrolase